MISITAIQQFIEPLVITIVYSQQWQQYINYKHKKQELISHIDLGYWIIKQSNKQTKAYAAINNRHIKMIAYKAFTNRMTALFLFHILVDRTSYYYL